MKIRWWAVGRRVQYGVGFSIFWCMVGVFIYFNSFYVSPTCKDRMMNGDETGIDCGGSCVQMCAADVLQPKVVWAESFEIVDGQYNVVAYLENPNQIAGAPELNYKFELFNNGTLVGEKSGKTSLPPNSIHPIFEGRVFTENNSPVTETKISLDNVELWLPASVVRDQFRATDINLKGSDVKPQLDVEITNTSLSNAENMEVVATIFNDAGDPVTASQTFVENISARSSKKIVFTWPRPIAKTVKSCVIPTDVAVVIDLSGSMNNDEGTPPQPITSTLEAASKFVNSLRENDQVSVVTFATEGRLVNTLTTSNKQVADSILNLKIEPKDETGFTNTVAALTLAQNELSSPRHNSNARRVLVLLTDGLPTTSGEADIISETEQKAKEINDDGVEVYSIGLGAGVDKNFIQKMTTDSSNVFFAPSGEDLESIYSEITSSLCEFGPTKIDVVTKIETNFAEIR
jgi:Mg-chelatase subunit ChlD